MAGRTWSVEEEQDCRNLEWDSFSARWPERPYNGYRFKRSRLLEMQDGESTESGIIFHDRVKPKLNWRDAIHAAQTMQEIAHGARSSQETAVIELDASDGDPFILFLSDTHIGDWGTDYELFERITDEIINTPNLFVGLLGDLANMAIKLRGVAEVTGGNLYTPQLQADILESWLTDIAHKVAFATWDNHGVEREEAGSGISAIKALQAKHTVYFGGIGHPDILVGEQLYRFAVSHRFRGSSIDNPVHASMRYLRREGPQRELAAMGDYHVPGISKFVHGGVEKVAVNTGSTQTGSAYARRHYSLFTQPAMPGVVLSSDEHCITPYYSIGEWKRNRA